MGIRAFCKKNTIYIYLILAIAGIVSLPLLAEGVLAGTNLQDALSRIEAIKEGFGKVLPIRVSPVLSADYGYGASSFQADVFMVIPAILRLLGFRMEASYELFLCMINLMTAWVAYHCFQRMSGRKELGLVGSMLYTWCPYRVSDLYINANLGESIAWAFLPIVLLGLVQLYDRADERKCKGSRITLVLGFSLLLGSSVTFFCIAVGMALLVFVMMGRRSLSKTVLLCVGEIALATVALNAWFFVPMLLRMRDASVVAPMIYENFRKRGMYLMQYLSLFPTAGDGLDFMKSGAVNAQAMEPGAAVLVLSLFYLWSVFVGKTKDVFGKRMLCVSTVLIVLSCGFFPWDLLQNKNLASSIVLALLQSPAKWGVAVCVCGVWIACQGLDGVRQQCNEKLYRILLVVTAAVSFGTTQLLSESILRKRGRFNPDTEGWWDLSLQVVTQESVVWRLCEAVTVGALCVCLVLWIVRRRKGVKK